MNDLFQFVINALLGTNSGPKSFTIFNPSDQLVPANLSPMGIAQTLNAAFLIALSGNNHPEYEVSMNLLREYQATSQWQEIANFYLEGLERIPQEINSTLDDNDDFCQNLKRLADWLSDDSNSSNLKTTEEYIWAVFFPEAVGIRQNKKWRIDDLQKQRVINITSLNPFPITDPVKQILFTSNVLLTTPHNKDNISELPYPNEIIRVLIKSFQEDQRYWYDHPIPIGVEIDQNEIIYGLKGLDEAMEYECERGNIPPESKLTCLLSVSTTHQSLQKISKQYIKEEIKHAGGLQHIEVFILTETDTQNIIQDILSPSAKHYLQHPDPKSLLSVFGVDGAYGRHYSFLKAISAFWSVMIQPAVKGTFKIDLDQIFPQEKLLAETGQSAFEHFQSPLWGAQGIDINGKPVVLGMLAGALVNEKDIHQSLYTPDVPFPDHELTPDQYIFFSQLPQALSTEAEMMARYNTEGLDGLHYCIQRIHVTGGTNGILVDSLRLHRPFTPSFIGRAEDQAYILSDYSNNTPNLAYVHKDGLIMRHDKEAFAQTAIESAHIGKLIGDYVRLIYFSAYARVLTEDITPIKDKFNPFTGCFISHIPITVTYLRFALKAASFFSSQANNDGFEFVRLGAQRISQALNNISGRNSQLAKTYDLEREGWNIYYDTLDSLEYGLNSNDNFASSIRDRSIGIIQGCKIHSDEVQFLSTRKFP